MVSAHDVAKAGCKYLGRSYNEMDCQGFVEKCLADCGIYRDLRGSNAWYRQMTWVGSPEDCKRQFGEIPKGAFLFILEQDGKEDDRYKKDGLGNASHIGIKTGMTGKQMVELAAADGNQNAKQFNKGDGALHSSASRKHVCTSVFKDKTMRGSWNRIGLWNKLDYGPAINALLGTPMAEAPTDLNTATVIGTGTVFASNGSTVKMRARPSTGCGTYWDVPIGETVEILNSGDWNRIRWNGRIGYMRSEFIKTGETMATIEPDPEIVPKLATVWAESGDTVKMRYKPDTNCALFERVPVGATVSVVRKGEHWTQINAGNRAGWYMMTKFLKFKEE